MNILNTKDLLFNRNVYLQVKFSKLSIPYRRNISFLRDFMYAIFLTSHRKTQILVTRRHGPLNKVTRILLLMLARARTTNNTPSEDRRCGGEPKVGLFYIASTLKRGGKPAHYETLSPSGWNEGYFVPMRTLRTFSNQRSSGWSRSLLRTKVEVVESYFNRLSRVLRP